MNFRPHLNLFALLLVFGSPATAREIWVDQDKGSDQSDGSEATPVKNVVTGRYMMHNAMRHALGQPRSGAGFEKLDPEMKTYLDSVLDRVLK